MQLTTERLILRDFTPDDWPAVLAYQSKPLYLRYYAWTERTPEAVRDFIDIFIAQQSDSPRTKYQFAVTLKASGTLIGCAGVRKDSPDSHQASIGYELDPAHWGKGYATEATRTLMNYGFDVLKVHRIWAHCVADNLGSQHVLEKLGLRREAHLRDAEYYKGRYWDEYIYAILESEWTGGSS
jgi:[ribosomal protein S5]-alanine N-acetyltransferase